MATTQFNSLVRQVARRLQEPQADVAGYLTGTHDRYSAALIAGHLNRAITDFIVRKWAELGRDVFPDVLPELIKETELPLADGVLARPSDCFYVVSINTLPAPGGPDDEETPPVYFTPLRSAQLAAARTFTDARVKPSATEPRWYDASGAIGTLGITGGVSVALRYVLRPVDIVMSEAAAGNGKWLTLEDEFTEEFVPATKRLNGTFNVNLAASDVGKRIMFRTATKVYHATIAAFINATGIILAGTDLPTEDVPSIAIEAALISDVSPETTDLMLSQQWWSTLEEEAVKSALADAHRGLLGQTDRQVQ